MKFYYLILGHFLGDFVFQSNIIAVNKTKYWYWNLLHTIIVAICMLTVSLPFSLYTKILVLASCIIHYFVDYIKSRMPSNSYLSLFYFVVDQVVHISIIYVISRLSADDSYVPLVNKQLLMFILSLIFVWFFSSIFIQYVLRIIFKLNKKEFFSNNEKAIGDFTRVSLFLITYFTFNIKFLFYFLIVFTLAGLFFYYFKKCAQWMRLKYFLTKISMDVLTVILCCYFLSYIV